MPVGFDILSARRVDWRGSRPVEGDSASRIPGGWLAGVGDGGGALRLQIGAKREGRDRERSFCSQWLLAIGVVRREPWKGKSSKTP
jgi:hypothetical protein